MTSNNCLLIALGNKARVGKDTFADNIKCHRFSFARPVYAVMQEMQDSVHQVRVKDRPLLRKIASMMRKHYGDNVFVDEIHNKLAHFIPCNDGLPIVVTDMRFKIEWNMLRQLGFTMVRIDRPGIVTDNHESECELDDMTYDYVLTNNGTLDDYTRNVQNFVSHLQDNLCKGYVVKLI
jgi:hypothetical protein